MTEFVLRRRLSDLKNFDISVLNNVIVIDVVGSNPGQGVYSRLTVPEAKTIIQYLQQCIDEIETHHD